MKTSDRFGMALDIACAAIAVLFSDRIAEQMQSKDQPVFDPADDPQVTSDGRRLRGMKLGLNVNDTLLAEVWGCPFDDILNATRCGSSDLRTRVALRAARSVYFYARKLADGPRRLALRDELTANIGLIFRDTEASR